MKLVHVVPHVDQEASGPAYSVPRLCESLAALGHEVELTCLAARGDIRGVALDLHPQWPVPRRLAVSFSLAGALARKARHVDVVHNHSLWSMVNISAGWFVPGARAKLVISPRGTLSPWARSRSREIKRVLWLLQRRALTKADLLHATSHSELQDIRGLGLKAPVAVVPNGIDLPALGGTAKPGDVRTLLFLGRIHPTKCVERLLHAWQALQHRHPAWKLKIVGPGDANYLLDLRALGASLRLERIEFTGPVYGGEKSGVYRDADLFVLPSHSENFGMAVAEALAHGCPAVVSRGAPWGGLEEHGCGWWVEHDIGSLHGALDKAMSTVPERLMAMGQRGREWMARDFGWDSVARRMEEAYEWIVNGGDIPDSVHLE